MRSFRLLAAVAAAAFAVTASAQAPSEAQQSQIQRNHHFFYFGSGAADSTAYAKLVEQFYADQYMHAQDPRAPYFLLMSRKADLAMGIGGNIKAIANYNWDGMDDGYGFAPYDIPIPVDRANMTSLNATMGESSLFFTVFGNNSRFGMFKLYIEAKFAGGGGSQLFKLKKAYATVGDWTLGYTKSTFVDPATQPMTIETDGPNSEVDDTRMLLRYMHQVGKGFSFAVSGELPKDDIASSSYYKGTNPYMPNFAAFLQWQWAKNQHIRVMGIVRPMRYRNLVEGENAHVAGWGINVATVFRPVAPLTVYGAFNTGRGISGMINDLGGSDTDLIGLNAGTGKMYAPQSFGWYGALQYHYSPSVFSTVMFSQERMLPKHNAVYGGAEYKYGLYGTANVFWSITPRCLLGAEFNIGKRANMDGTHRLGYRAGLLAQYSF